MDSRGDTLTREKLHVKDTACSKTENKLSRRARMFQRKSRNASNLRQQMLSYFCYNASYSFIAVSVTIIRDFFYIRFVYDINLYLYEFIFLFYSSTRNVVDQRGKVSIFRIAMLISKFTRNHFEYATSKPVRHFDPK